MKKYLYTIATVIAIIASPFLVQALSIPVNRTIKGAEQLLYPTDSLLVGASATTTKATLEVAGSFAIASSTTGCAQAGTGGLIFFTGTNCGSGSSSFGQAWEVSGGFLSPTTTIPIAITSIATSTFAGPVSIAGYVIATTTTVGPVGSDATYLTDGVADCVQFQAAIDNLSGMGGGELKVKRGSYDISCQVNLKNNITITGEGDATIFNVSVHDVSTTVRAGFQASSTQNVVIQNVHVDGAGQSSSNLNADIGIEISSSTNFKLLNSTFTNMNGFSAFISANNDTHTGTSSAITIANNYMQCNGLQDCIGGGPHENSGYSSTQDINILGNHIIQTQTTGTDQNCVDIVRVLRVNINGNNCKGSILFGYERVPNSKSSISNNIIDKNNGTSLVSGEIVIQTDTSVLTSNATNTPNNMIISGNTLTNGDIYIQGGSANPIQGLVIAGNTIITSPVSYTGYGPARHGIYMTQTKNSEVNNNVITGASGTTATGIVFDNSTNNTASLNTINGFAVGLDLGSGTGNRDTLNTYLSDTINSQNGAAIMYQAGVGDGSLYLGTTSPVSGFTNGLFLNNMQFANTFSGIIPTNSAAQPTQNYFNNFNNSGAILVRKVGVGAGDYIEFQKADTTSLAVLKSSGNFGIGTSTPGTLFGLGTTGGINLNPTATSSFGSSANGINLTNGCFSIGGTCVGGSGSGSGTVGSGTLGQLPYYAGAGTTLTATSSLFVDTTGFVGIGTTTPWGQFSVNPVNSATKVPDFVVGSSTRTRMLIAQDGSLLFATTSASTGSTKEFLLDNFQFANTNSNVIPNNSANQTTQNYFNNFNNAGGILVRKASTGAGDYIEFQKADATSLMVLKSSGFLGIGTSTPQTQLQVSSGASATTTVTVGELGLTSSKSCVNMNASDGSASSFYINAAHAMVVEARYCR